MLGASVPQASLLDLRSFYDELVSYREMIRPYVCDVSAYLHNAIKEGKDLLEGQLVLL